MYRYVDMALRLEAQASNLDSLFGTRSWRLLSGIENSSLRQQETVALFSEQLSGRWVTHLNMLGSNNSLKYALIHATNHPAGRETMKDAIWSAVPDGSFSASERHSPYQPVLIVPEPDLRPLEEGLEDYFNGTTQPLDRLYVWLLDTIYRKPHLHDVLLEGFKRGRILLNGQSEKRIAWKYNPQVTFLE